jgi:hypothetical protein
MPFWRFYAVQLPRMVQRTPLDETLFSLHNPVNYVNWLGTHEKRPAVLE